MKTSGWLMIFVLAACAVLRAQSLEVAPAVCGKTLTIQQFLLPEDAAAARLAFLRFQKALRSGSRQQVIEQIAFPASFVLDGQAHRYETAQEFVEKFDSFFTREVKEAVFNQNPDELLADWEGVELPNGLLRFKRDKDGKYRVSQIRSHYEEPPEWIAEFDRNKQLCVPTVIEGRIVAYNWVSHVFTGALGISADYLIVDVSKVLSGTVPGKRIRVDFWGEKNSKEYNLPEEVFKAGSVWRIYLRPANQPPQYPGICDPEVQETIQSVDKAGKVLSEESALMVLIGTETLTYKGLGCYQAYKEYFQPIPAPDAVQ